MAPEATTDDDWEQAEGVPSLSDPFIQKYLAGRDALVQEEKKQRSGTHRAPLPTGSRESGAESWRNQCCCGEVAAEHRIVFFATLFPTSPTLQEQPSNRLR
jgi:hypothetical protein